MRLVLRLVVLLSTVCGVSLAFAWAWDHSERSGAAAAHTAPGAPDGAH